MSVTSSTGLFHESTSGDVVRCDAQLRKCPRKNHHSDPNGVILQQAGYSLEETDAILASGVDIDDALFAIANDHILASPSVERLHREAFESGLDDEVLNEMIIADIERKQREFETQLPDASDYHNINTDLFEEAEYVLDRRSVANTLLEISDDPDLIKLVSFDDDDEDVEGSEPVSDREPFQMVGHRGYVHVRYPKLKYPDEVEHVRVPMIDVYDHPIFPESRVECWVGMANADTNHRSTDAFFARLDAITTADIGRVGGYDEEGQQKAFNEAFSDWERSFDQVVTNAVRDYAKKYDGDTVALEDPDYDEIYSAIEDTLEIKDCVPNLAVDDYVSVGETRVQTWRGNMQFSMSLDKGVQVSALLFPRAHPYTEEDPGVPHLMGTTDAGFDIYEKITNAINLQGFGDAMREEVEVSA